MLLQPVLGLAENGIEPDKTTKNVPRRMYSYHRTDVKLNFQCAVFAILRVTKMALPVREVEDWGPGLL